MRTLLFRALLFGSVALLALLMLATFARGEPIGLRMMADCWPAETGFTVLTGRGLLLRDAWQDDYGQGRERWEAAGGAVNGWAEVMLGEGPGGAGRCIVASSKPAGEPS